LHSPSPPLPPHHPHLQWYILSWRKQTDWKSQQCVVNTVRCRKSKENSGRRCRNIFFSFRFLSFVSRLFLKSDSKGNDIFFSSTLFKFWGFRHICLFRSKEQTRTVKTDWRSVSQSSRWKLFSCVVYADAS
jgi:hypothetical protein